MAIRRFGVPGYGLITAAVLLLFAELCLHSDAWLYKYRSVFAAGRAQDKLQYVEAHPPRILLIGNSRVDNGFDPRTLSGAFGNRMHAFNLGVPGANARILYGMLARLEHAGELGPQQIAWVVIGLDEAMLHADDSLGYAAFFADRRALWQEGEYRDLVGSAVRLWSYAPNLKQLRDPAKLLAFAAATRADIDPIGGAARAHLGYRAGFTGGNQDAGQVQMQEAGAQAPPDPATERYLWRSIDLLARNRVRIAVVFPPLLKRQLLYVAPESPGAQPYIDVARQLSARGVALITLDPDGPRRVEEFANAGHLNDRGAQRYTRLLGLELGRVWPELSGAAQ